MDNKELIRRLVSFDDGDVSTGYNSVSGSGHRPGKFWDADYGQGFGNSHSFGYLWVCNFPDYIHLDRKSPKDFVIRIVKPITVMMRTSQDEPYSDIKLEFIGSISFEGDIVDGVYPVVWYDKFIKTIEEWIPDRSNIRTWPARVDVFKHEWTYKVIPAFEKAKRKILNTIEKKFKPGLNNSIEEYFEGNGQ